MATADEKQAKQDARDAATNAAVQGKARLQTEVGRAARAFSGRRLRSAGDLSRYAIGGFSDDPLAPKPTTPKPTVKPKPVKAAPRPAARRTVAPRPKKKKAAPKIGAARNLGNVGTGIVKPLADTWDRRQPGYRG